MKKLLSKKMIFLFVFPILLTSCDQDGINNTLQDNIGNSLSFAIKDNKTLNKFNQSIKIKVIQPNLNKDKIGSEKLRFNYMLKNTSGKLIKFVSWISVYHSNSKIIYNAEIAVDLSRKPLLPQETMQVETFQANDNTRNINNELSLKLEQPMDITIVVRTIIFSDGTKIEVTD